MGIQSQTNIKFYIEFTCQYRLILQRTQDSLIKFLNNFPFEAIITVALIIPIPRIRNRTTKFQMHKPCNLTQNTKSWRTIWNPQTAEHHAPCRQRFIEVYFVPSRVKITAKHNPVRIIKLR